MIELARDEWQIAQIFLSETGVQEVYVHADSRKVRCTCDGFGSRSVCKHARFVTDRMKLNGGVYPVQVSNKASESEGTFASLDPKLFRDFLVKYGKIEVI